MNAQVRRRPKYDMSALATLVALAERRPACDICGSQTDVRPIDELPKLRADLAGWLERLCSRCATKYAAPPVRLQRHRELESVGRRR